MKKTIRIQDYAYDLPPGKIASYPIPIRDQSKLLVYRDGQISNSKFDQIATFLPENTVLVFNNTKVIPARLLFQKDSGAAIEVFLLTPAESHTLQNVMQSTGPVRWNCTVGKLKRWSPGIQLTKEVAGRTLLATLIDRKKGLVEFSWSPGHLNFADILETFGITPLPPYIKRDVQADDRERYQTVYSSLDGAVAAPTAGMHFTQRQLQELTQKGIITDFLTLHVSAGTFQPIKVETAAEHSMHSEQIIVTDKNIQHLLSDRKIVAVGTTSLRTLESLYWYGANLLENPEAEFNIEKLDPYDRKKRNPSVERAFRAVADTMQQRNVNSITGETSIFILPGYQFKVCDALITNFHQPASTLMLLVAAFVGNDWKEIYKHALANEYRFLSYGDSSLLIPEGF